MPILSMLSGPFHSLRRRFSGRLDSEHEQAFVRLVIGILLFFYFFEFYLRSEPQEESWDLNFTWVMGLFIIASIILIVHIAAYPRISRIRRLLAAALDSGTITYFFFNAAESALPLYFLYLWVIFGHGFRFGKRYLFFTLALSLLGFGAVILRIPYWENNLPLGIGLWVGMFFVSLYVSTLVGRLTTALEAAESANQSKRRFISTVSHELRTPLNAIIGMGDLLRSTKLTVEQEDMVYSVDNASRMMLSLIEDVLDFSKIEAGKLVIENTEFDLHQLINSTVDVFRYQASENGLRLTSYIDPSVPYALRGDPHHLRQVLVNLLSNGIKFTKEGSVVLRIDSLVETAQSVQLRFEVEDTGIGISAEAQAKVFDSFTQADDSTTRRYGGTGLGTTISKQLVELMGGKLGLRSELGVGSMFWFELELQKMEVAEDQQIFAEFPVLLIGLNDEETPHLTELLKSWNISFQSVENVEVAVKALEDAARSGKAIRLALFSGTLVKAATSFGQPSARFLQGSCKMLHDAVPVGLSIILCGVNGIGGQADQQVIENAGLSGVLSFPIEKRLLFNAIHAVAATEFVFPETASPIDADQKKKPQHAQYNILVAEDNPTNSKVIQKILQRAGHLCTLVQNGEEALDLLSQQDFDLIVFDMNMPVMNGLDATKAYRFMRPADMRAPVIMFSADVTTEAKEECLRGGVDEFLPKPIQVNLFLETLERLVKKSLVGRHTESFPKAVSAIPILAQPPSEKVILNYATLAELERIGQDRMFVENLLSGFTEDSQKLVEKLEESLRLMRFEEFKEILHAIKGSAASIGAVSLRETCHQYEKITHSELKADSAKVLNIIKTAFNQLRQALDLYRKQRNKAESLKH
jgi:two-component system sensor histidine kinase RpfC